MGAIWALIKDDTGKGVESIEFTGPGTKKTNDVGFASFDPLSPNTYQVTATVPLPDPVKADFHLPEPYTKSVDVKASQVVQVSFQLKRRPTPSISVDAPKIVLVKRNYQGKVKPGVKPHRIAVRLGYTGDHDGVGELSCTPEDVKVFDKADDDDDKAKALPWKITASELKGKTVYVEAAKESSAMNGTTLKLTLKDGTIPPKTPEASETITCLLLQLNVYKPRPEDNSAPVKIEDGPKLDPGRALIVQGSADNLLFAHRAKLALMQAKPTDYTGKLVLKPIGGNLDIFDSALEVPAPGQNALDPSSLKFDNGTIDGTHGTVFFVQGRSKSMALGDCGWTVECEDVPGKEGDRVTMTALKAELRLFKSKPADNSGPVVISDADKVDKGRFVHKQDTDNNHGRAQLVVRNLEPAGFACKLSLSCWTLGHNPYTEAKSGAPKVKLFDAETAGSAFAFDAEIDHPGGAAGDLKTLWIEGATTSGALIDTQIRLNVKEVDLGCDRANSTVVEFTKIKATIKSTPALTVRVGYAAPADHTYETMQHTDDFSDGKNEPLVLIRNPQPDIALELTALPASPVDLDITWKAVRNTVDHATIGGKNDLPTVTRDGADKRKATLSANARGSFRIRPYIDCNGVDEYSPKEPSIPMNLVLADVIFVADNSAGIVGNLTSVAAGNVSVRNGTWPDTWPACTSPGGAGMTMELVADVMGGGADGRLGLDRVFGGLINMLTDNQITLTYTTPAPVTYTVRNRYVLNRAAATGLYGPTPMFLTTDPPPDIMPFPVLDTGRPNGGLGGESAVMGRSGVWDLKADRPLGSRYTLRCIDSPGRAFLLNHSVDPTAQLTAIHYVQAFRANFCFWTNVTKNRGTTGDPCDRVYSAVRTMNWEAHGDWNVTYTPGATLTNTNPHVIAISSPTTVSPVGRAQDNGVETRPPSGITTAISWVTS